MNLEEKVSILLTNSPKIKHSDRLPSVYQLNKIKSSTIPLNQLQQQQKQKIMLPGISTEEDKDKDYLQPSSSKKIRLIKDGQARRQVMKKVYSEKKMGFNTAFNNKKVDQISRKIQNSNKLLSPKNIQPRPQSIKKTVKKIVPPLAKNTQSNNRKRRIIQLQDSQVTRNASNPNIIKEFDSPPTTIKKKKIYNNVNNPSQQYLLNKKSQQLSIKNNDIFKNNKSKSPKAVMKNINKFQQQIIKAIQSVDSQMNDIEVAQEKKIVLRKQLQKLQKLQKMQKMQKLSKMQKLQKLQSMQRMQKLQIINDQRQLRQSPIRINLQKRLYYASSKKNNYKSSKKHRYTRQEITIDEYQQKVSILQHKSQIDMKNYLQYQQMLIQLQVTKQQEQQDNNNQTQQYYTSNRSNNNYSTIRNISSNSNNIH